MSAERCEFTDACRCTSCLNEMAENDRNVEHEDDICPVCHRFYDDCLCDQVPDEFDGQDDGQHDIPDEELIT